MNKEDILRKVRILIAKADNEASTDAEVYLCMAKAQELMTKYKISENEIQISQEEIIEIEWNTYIKFFDSINHFINNEYLAHLAWVIAENNYCRAFNYAGIKNIDLEPYKMSVIKFIGKKLDVENTLNLFNFTFKKFLNMSLIRYKEAKRVKKEVSGLKLEVVTSYQYVDKAVFIRSYLKGTIEGLKEKYANNSYELEQTQGYALMLINYDLTLTKYINKTIGPIMTLEQRKTMQDHNAFLKGKRDANTNDLKRIEQ